MTTMELTIREMDESIRSYEYRLQLLMWERALFSGMMHKLKAGKLPVAPKRSRMLRVWIIIKYTARDVWREVRGGK
jgi:hypothetical protein